jgi:hypothetical protein
MADQSKWVTGANVETNNLVRPASAPASPEADDDGTADLMSFTKDQLLTAAADYDVEAGSGDTKGDIAAALVAAGVTAADLVDE